MQIVHLQSVTGYITSYPKPERTAMVSFLCVCANEFTPAVMWRRKCMKEVGLNNCPFIESKIKMTCKDVYNSETDYFHFQDLFAKHFLSREVKSGFSSIPIFSMIINIATRCLTSVFIGSKEDKRLFSCSDLQAT